MEKNNYRRTNYSRVNSRRINYRKKNIQRLIASGLTFVLAGTGLGVGIANFKKAKTLEGEIANLKAVNNSLAQEINNKECKVPAMHKHTYINESGFKVQLRSEEPEFNGFIKQNDYSLIFDDASDLEDRLFLEGYVAVADNKELIQYYENFLSGSMPYTDDLGETHYKRFAFYGYNIEFTDDGYEMVKSSYVGSLLDIMDDYPYFKMDNFYELVDEDEISNDYESYFDSDEYTEDGESFGDDEFGIYFSDEEEDNSWFEGDTYQQVKVYTKKNNIKNHSQKL